MDDRDILRKERLERVNVFGNENKDDWPSANPVTIRFANISRIVKALGLATVGQIRTLVAKQTLLDALWLDFKNIARTARAIALDEPGFSGDYRLPDDANETPIKTHADALLQLLEDNNAPVAEGGDTPEQKAAKAALRAKFIAYFLPDDFVEDLRADRDALDGKNLAKTSDNLVGLKSTKDIDTLLEQGAAEVIHLDAAMQNLYARNPGQLRAWLAASRVERSPQRKKKPADPASTPTGPTQP